MVIMEAIGWMATAALGIHGTPVADAVNKYNNHFAKKVDAGHSCYSRTGGDKGSYGSPDDYSLDLACNYRLKKVAREGVVYDWVLERK